MCDRFEGVGVTPRELAAGTVVMVPVGQTNALVNGGPSLVAWATVLSPVDPDGDAADPGTLWWLDVHVGPGLVLAQMYRADWILGIPARGLSMAGAG